MRKIIAFAILAFILLSAAGCSTSPPGKIGGGMNSCVCTQEYSPVCGEDKVTYSNPCYAGCASVKYTQGACAK